ncbi:zinc finger protein ZAT11-like [Arachis stenosperma]|uniref:zinc finger protein ZAT11-like n=1 Tax=Arachis stenosperma TaxID=217475 RepID=UPI0025AD18F9|nr:zinc finger protein ZAT11-like [Arachis stenosperma]
MTVIKRERETNNEKESIDYLANTLMLLSSAIELKSSEKFECKTCGRKFASFQALGGHRTSHKRQKHNGDHGDEQQLNSEPKKPKKMHECSICGMGFSLGQQLGGHMRKHRENNNNKGFSSNPINHAVVKVPVLKRSNSKRVMCMDLNLTPLENDLKLLFGNKAPRVDLSFL